MIGFLKKRRSIRKYKDVEVEKEKLDKILKAALLAPSSKGLRTWEF
ncbi:TPA: nitroreductase family protein, partial [Clostridioides difficile]|nr:nitroreductase family protein [Clostridioides difficile]